jgi:NADH:ubiquinone oxidoreductase subunit
VNGISKTTGANLPATLLAFRLDVAGPWRHNADVGSAHGRRVAAGKFHVLGKIFTWWNGATIGAMFDIGRRGSFVGADERGNRYFEERKPSLDGCKRRWVIYNGYADPTTVSADWHGWLHHTFAEPPTVEPLLRRPFEKDHLPNMTGTALAHRPAGSLARGGRRAASTSDYEAWSPEAD